MHQNALQINTNQSKSLNKQKYWIDLTMFSCKSTQIKNDIHVQTNLQDLENLHLQINTNQSNFMCKQSYKSWKIFIYKSTQIKAKFICKQSYQSY